MKRFKTVLGLLMALLMLMGCMPLALAKGASGGDPAAAASSPSGADAFFSSSEPERIIPQETTLSEAAAYEGAVDPVELTCASASYCWQPSSATDDVLGRTVAAARVFNGTGTKTATMTATKVLNVSRWPYVSFRCRVTNGSTLTVTCTNLTSNTSSTLLTIAGTNSNWQYFGAYYREQGYTGNAQLQFNFVYTYTAVTSGSTSYCRLTDLVIGDGIDPFAAAVHPACDLVLTDTETVEANIYTDANFGEGRMYTILNCDPDEYLDESYVMLYGTCAATAGSVISFDYASSLDYMNGDIFEFGRIVNGTFQSIFSGEDEGGDGYIEGDGTVEDWASYSYTIPSTGLYKFAWRLNAWTYSSIVAVDNIKITPRVTLNDAAVSSGSISFNNDDDHPWVPYYRNNRLCAASGVITHSQSSVLEVNGVILREGDTVSFDWVVSSEEDYDEFTFYYINEAGSASRVDEFVASGQAGAWSTHTFAAPADGSYTLGFEYKKDHSVSSDEDRAYISRLSVPVVTAQQAFEGDTDYTISMSDNYVYSFAPAICDGELVLASENKYVDDSYARLLVTAPVNLGTIFSFEYKKSSEANYDNFYVYVMRPDGTVETILEKQNDTNGWEKVRFYADAAGTYQFGFEYAKDEDSYEGEDTVWLRNFDVKIYDLNYPLNNFSAEPVIYPLVDQSSLFEIETEGSRQYVKLQSSGSESAGFGYTGHLNVAQYIFFQYKTLGDGAEIMFFLNGHLVTTLTDTGSSDWLDYLYRIDVSGDYTLRIIATSQNGDPVYIDNVFIDYGATDPRVAIPYPGQNLVFESYGDFTGIYDPLNPNIQDNCEMYAMSTVEAGKTAYFGLRFNATAGSTIEVCYSFLSEDGVPNGSWLEICMPEYPDRFIGIDDNDYLAAGNEFNVFTTMSATFLKTETVTIGIVYHSNAEDSTDGVAIGYVRYNGMTYTLDEALNIEGGTLHFSDPDGLGCFVPAMNGAPAAQGERLYAEPYLGAQTNFTTLNFDFQSTSDLNYLYFVDMDGDGSGFARMSLLDIGVGGRSEYALVSPSLTDDQILHPDDWVVFRSITIPWGSNTPSVSLTYCKYDLGTDIIGIYVIKDDDLYTAELLHEETLTDTDRHNIGISLHDYRGQTIRIAIRHTAGASHGGGLYIDDVYIGFDPANYSTVSFEAEAFEGSYLTFDLYVDPQQSIESGTTVCIAVYEDGVNIYNNDSTSIYNNYGSSWQTFYVTNVTPGVHEYRILLYTVCFSTMYSELFPIIYLDEVGMISYHTLTFISELDGGIIETVTVPHGGAGEFPTPPAYTGYTFTGWSVDDLSCVTEDMTIYAEYSVNVHTFTVHYQYEDGTEAAPDYIIRLAYGSIATLPLPTISGYTPNWEDYSFYMPDYDVTITVTYYPDATGLTGDIDCDGDIDFDDVTLLNAYLLNAAELTEQGLINANVNGDNKVSSADVVALNKLILGSN